MRRMSLLRNDHFRQHETPQFHPEAPARLIAIDELIGKSDLPDVVDLEGRAATESELCLVHAPEYIESLSLRADKARSRSQLIQLDGDTFMSHRSFDIAKLAVGAGLKAVESVRGGSFMSSFVAVRPPGHHALVARPMGFCLFNNIAVSARHARNVLGYKRVMIIDWDVHHGNGTQAIFYDDPSVLFVSLHQYPCYPSGSGWYTEDGANEGRGFNVNIPLPAGTGDRGYLAAWDALVTPIALSYAPDLILLSAGYDAHQDDPLAEQAITTVGYAMLSQRLLDVSNATNAKVVCFLEGGYNPDALAESVVATMRVLSAQDERRLAEVHCSYIMPGPASGAIPVTGDQSANEVDDRLIALKKHFSKYWPCLK